MPKKVPWERKIIGVIVIMLGVIGLVLPGLQGIALIIIGATMLGNKKIIHTLQRWRNVISKKWKQLFSKRH